MKYNQYGKTGKQVSAVGFGGMRFDLEKSNEENAELVRYANSKGITYLDTAPGYCNDQSEDIMAIALKDMPDKWTISTKAMPTSHETAEKGYEAVAQRALDLGAGGNELHRGNGFFSPFLSLIFTACTVPIVPPCSAVAGGFLF